MTAESMAARRKNAGVAAKALRKGEAEMRGETEAAATAETGQGRGGTGGEVAATAEIGIETGGEEAGAGRGTEGGAVTAETETAGRGDAAGVTAGNEPESSSTEIVAEAETTPEGSAGVEAEAATGRRRGRRGGAGAKARRGKETGRKPAVRKLLKRKRPEQHLTGLKTWTLKPSKIAAGEGVRSEKIEIAVGVQKQRSFLSPNPKIKVAVAVLKRQSSLLLKTKVMSAVLTKRSWQLLVRNSPPPLWKKA